jgi:hypothetical protein
MIKVVLLVEWKEEEVSLGPWRAKGRAGFFVYS